MTAPDYDELEKGGLCDDDSDGLSATGNYCSGQRSWFQTGGWHQVSLFPLAAFNGTSSDKSDISSQ